MIRCKACGRFFRLKKRDKYVVKNYNSVFDAVMSTETVYECFDCPKCGCQNIVNIREEEKKGD